MMKVAGAIPGRGCTDLYCALGTHGVLLMREGVRTMASEMVGYTISDAIVHSWLWSIATRSCLVCYMQATLVALLKVVDN